MAGFLRIGLYRLFHELEKYFSSSYSPRVWSNRELGKFGHLFAGSVINVSGGTDRDKAGRFYRDYFPNAENYDVSNHKPSNASPEEELILDLESEQFPVGLIGRFDTVFTHTVLEHVYRLDRAVDNLCSLSRDMVISVVPFIQSFHCGKTFSDYWRFSPHAMRRLFEDRGFGTVYLTWNDSRLGNIYIFHIASRNPEKWEQISQQQPRLRFGPGYMRSYAGAGGYRDTDLTRCPGWAK